MSWCRVAAHGSDRLDALAVDLGGCETRQVDATDIGAVDALIKEVHNSHGRLDGIANFCRLKYGVTFPMMEKVHTKGPEQAPIYRTLTAESPEGMRGEIKWNFTKFLVNGDGGVVARFEPSVDPMDETIVSAVEGLLPAES